VPTCRRNTERHRTTKVDARVIVSAFCSVVPPPTPAADAGFLFNNEQRTKENCDEGRDEGQKNTFKKGSTASTAGPAGDTAPPPNATHRAQTTAHQQPHQRHEAPRTTATAANTRTSPAAAAQAPNNATSISLAVASHPQARRVIPQKRAVARMGCRGCPAAATTTQMEGHTQTPELPHRATSTSSTRCQSQSKCCRCHSSWMTACEHRIHQALHHTVMPTIVHLQAGEKVAHRWVSATTWAACKHAS
jgi:hypothetical protein